MTDDEGFAEVQWTLGTFTTEQTVNVEIKNSQGNSIGSVLQFTASAEEAEISITGDLNFGEVSIGSTEDRIFTIENESLTDVNVSSIDVPNGFTINWNNGLIPSESVQEITVTFSPTELQEYTGDIIINNNVDDINNLISVSGTGVVEDAISLTGDLDFGDVEINSTATRVLTIQNNTIIPIMVNSITLPNGFTANWTNGMIDGQSSQLVDIIFQPTNIQSYSGIVIVNNDLDSENNTISMVGDGVEVSEGIEGPWLTSYDNPCSSGNFYNNRELIFEAINDNSGIINIDEFIHTWDTISESTYDFDTDTGVLTVIINTSVTNFAGDSGYRNFSFTGTLDPSTDVYSGSFNYQLFIDNGPGFTNTNTICNGTMTLSRPE